MPIHLPPGPLARELPGALVALLLPALAAPRSYLLEGASRVGFSWQFGPDTVQGRMRVSSADLADLPASRVSVSVDVTGAEAGFPFASEAMKGPRVLDAGRYPTIDFASRRITRTGDGTARIEGGVTVRGVTRPMMLDATLHGDVADTSRLTIRLTGRHNRSEFGATGCSEMVGDEVRLDIEAEIAASG